ncbi:MAG: hypothetical protein LBU48_03005 [Coriobacteriales bacterium]|jgi:hypothetical protein|nr:hypothetical protein [Coriobacteriales bacterium]
MADSLINQASNQGSPAQPVAHKGVQRSVAPLTTLLSTADRLFLVIGTLLFSFAVPFTWWFALRTTDRERAGQGVRFSVIVIVISLVLYGIFGVWITAVLSSLFDALPRH